MGMITAAFIKAFLPTIFTYVVKGNERRGGYGSLIAAPSEHHSPVHSQHLGQHNRPPDLLLRPFGLERLHSSAAVGAGNTLLHEEPSL